MSSTPVVARHRSRQAPAYYLGRPAHVWMERLGARPGVTASRADKA